MSNNSLSQRTLFNDDICLVFAEVESNCGSAVALKSPHINKDPCCNRWTFFQERVYKADLMSIGGIDVHQSEFSGVDINLSWRVKATVSLIAIIMPIFFAGILD